MANVLFKKGLLANLPENKTAGTIYVTTDERAMYIDLDATNRIRLGDFVECADWSTVQAITNPSTTALYYAQDENILCKYDGTAWKQINPDSIINQVSTTVATGANDTVILSTQVFDNASHSPKGTLTIKGGGDTSVSVDGTALKISSTNTDTKVTSAANHYAPEEDTDSKLTSSSGFITGIKRDAKGHVVGIESSDSRVTNQVNSVSVTGVEGTANDNEITLQVSVTDGQGTKTGNKKIKGSGATTVSADNDGIITISSTDQSVDSAAHHYVPTGAAAETKSASGATGTNGSTVQVITGITTDAAGHVTGVVSGAATDSGKMDSVTVTEQTAGFSIAAKTDQGVAKSGTLDPTITVGKVAANQSTVHFASGDAALDVYTSGEVDSKISEAIAASNAIVIKGAASSASWTLPTSNVQAGDAYIVTYASGLSITVDGNAVVAEAGDLFIAKADIASGSTNANWYYIPAGNDLCYMTASASGAGIALKTKSDDITSGEFVIASAAAGEAGIVASAASSTETASGNTYTKRTVTLGMQWGSFDPET